MKQQNISFKTERIETALKGIRIGMDIKGTYRTSTAVIDVRRDP